MNKTMKEKQGDVAEVQFLLQSFENFNESTFRLQTAFKNLEQKFERLNRELEYKNTELNKAVEEKEELKNYLQNILESLTTGVIVIDKDGYVTIMNKCAEQFTGLLEQEARERHMDELFKPLFAFDRSSLHASQLGEENLGRKIKMRGRVLEVFSSPLKSTKRNIIGTVLVIRDITKIEKLEEMNQRSDKLAAMGELAANIAHEIRNPLGSIELFASLLLKNLPDGKERERVAQIIGSVKNVDNKISNLLMFTRKQNPVIKNICLHDILHEVLAFSGQITEQEDIKLISSFSAVKPIVAGDAEMLKQVFFNLILNAFQAMPDGGELVIETEIKKELSVVEVRVSDTGCGISSETIKKIYDPFFSTDEERAGLGLAIVHSIIENHNGSIDVENRNKGGAVFTITLPLLCQQDLIENEM